MLDRSPGAPYAWSGGCPDETQFRFGSGRGVHGSLNLIVATGFAFALGNFEFIFYVAVMLGLILVVWFVHRAVSLSRELLWALSLWGLLHMAGGLVPLPATWPIDGDIRVLYSLWLIPDRLKYD